PLVFGGTFLVPNQNVGAGAVAMKSGAGNAGFIGLDSIYVKNNLFVGSYDSSITTAPTTAVAGDDGSIGSNGAIYAKNNEQIADVLVGPVAPDPDLDDYNRIDLEQDIPTPDVPAGGGPGPALSLAKGHPPVTVPASGMLYYSSITLANGAVLTFDKPCTVFVDGNITFAQSGEIRANGDVPSNLKLYQRGIGAGIAASSSNNVTLIGEFVAPTSALDVGNNLTIMGSAIFKSIHVKNNAQLFFDTGLEGFESGGSSAVTLVE
ncbi:MAG: DUF7305 domain-containing protein, partial [Tepidisphaeraceae bacterium]